MRWVDKEESYKQLSICGLKLCKILKEKEKHFVDLPFSLGYSSGGILGGDYYPAPFLPDVVRYLLDKYNISIEYRSVWSSSGKGFAGYTYKIYNNDKFNTLPWKWNLTGEENALLYKSPTLALEAGIEMFLTCANESFFEGAKLKWN